MAKKKEQLKKSERILPEEHVLLDTLPQNVMKIGDIVQEGKNIYISQSVYKEIHEFTKDKLVNESGGMLVGYTLDEAEKTNIIIDGFIEAKHSQGTPTTLTFTHETWNHVNSTLEEEFPKEKIIGWIHTHPNFGIFLSNYDKFIQENYFNGENQVAYVVDPIQHTEGFFFWINGKITTCNGFYVYDEVGRQIEIEKVSPTVQNNSNTTLGQKTIPVNTYIMAAICLCLFIPSVYSLIQNNALTSKINSLSELVIKQQERIESMMYNFDNELSSAADNIGKCTAVFLNDDGTVFKLLRLTPGEMIEYPTEDPKKASDNTFTYSFAGWDKDPMRITENMIYHPIFDPTYIEYSIKFIDLDGNELSSMNYHYGDKVDIPDYKAEKQSDETYDYILGWDSDVTDVKSDATYTAVFKEVYKEYIISFLDEEGNELSKQSYHYGDSISIETPFKKDDDQYSYTFEKWDREFEKVSVDTSYTAFFVKTEKTVTEIPIEKTEGESEGSESETSDIA